jgi:2-dehydro-3-deoxy-L-rhamnonate dehydrogenase (NAD+)
MAADHRREPRRRPRPLSPRTSAYEARRGGRIVNIGSLAGKHGLSKLPVYSAASAGVIASTKALAQELAATEIRVNSVAPGPIETDLITRLVPDVVDMFVASSPMRRLGDPQEVAELVVWLCSAAWSFNTGDTYVGQCS